MERCSSRGAGARKAQAQDLRTSTLVWHRPIQGEGHIDILGESEGSPPQTQVSFPDVGEAINDFGPCREASHAAITLNPDSNFSRWEKIHSFSTELH